MKARFAAVGIIGLTTQLLAQAAPVAPAMNAHAPGDCLQALTDWRNAQTGPALAKYRAATPDTREAAAAAYSKQYSVIAKEAVRAGKECAAKFTVDGTPSAQLVGLVNLYAFVGDTTGRRLATERVMTAKDLPIRQRGQVMLMSITQEFARAADYFGIIEPAEAIVKQVDALPDSLADIKLAAHSSMMGRYEYLDVDDGLRNHASAVLALGRRLNKPDAMVNAYLSLARASADMLHPDSALMILKDAEKELGAARVAEPFADFRNRYALIGQKAATIQAQWWLNAPAAQQPIKTDDGKVRFLEFTAHWCGPCKNSYPGVRSLEDRFKGQPFEGLMLTSLYGYLGTQRGLTEEQEVAADKIYFAQEHQLPYKVAVNAMPKNAKGTATGQPQTELDYRVGGIPQIVIIDKRGVIREIVTGWDRGNTARIGDLIERLLKEPVM